MIKSQNKYDEQLNMQGFEFSLDVRNRIANVK